MKALFIFLSIFFVKQSFSEQSITYYIGQSPKNLMFHSGDVQYILAEKRGDSLQLWYGEKGRESSGIYMKYKSETILYKSGFAKNFAIKKVGYNKIIGLKMNLYKTKNLQHYFLMWNKIIASQVEKEYDDSVVQIRQIKFYKTYSAKLLNGDTLEYLISHKQNKIFETEYRNLVFDNLKFVNKDLNNKQKLLDNLQDGTVIADSLVFKRFLTNYERGMIDHKILVYILINHPTLFYLRKMDVDGILGDEILYCEDCFTAKEKLDMFNSLKPYREKCPAIFWMFDAKGQRPIFIDY